MLAVVRGIAAVAATVVRAIGVEVAHVPPAVFIMQFVNHTHIVMR